MWGQAKETADGVKGFSRDGRLRFEWHPWTPEAITTEGLTAFRQTELPGLKKFQEHPPTREQFEADLVKEVRANISGMEVLKSSYSLFTVLFSIFGIASAFKIAAGFDD